jgi:hypothetical protein
LAQLVHHQQQFPEKKKLKRISRVWVSRFLFGEKEHHQEKEHTMHVHSTNKMCKNSTGKPE